MTFIIEEQTGILSKKAARLFERVANQGLDELGVTYAQTIFLVRLWEKDGQSQTELSQSAALQQPTVVRILDRMERDQLIKRVRNNEDKRVFNFYLTEKAKKVCPKLEAYSNRMNDIATAHFSKNEIKQLNQLLKKMILSLEDFLLLDSRG